EDVMESEIVQDQTEKLATSEDPISLEEMGDDPSLGGPTSKELEQFLAAARERLDMLVGELRAIDTELEGLAPDRHQHQLLQGLCNAFDQLNQAGAAPLFWGDDRPTFDVDERLRTARERVGAFDERIGAIEKRRREQLEEINQQQEHAQWLEDD